MILCLFTGFVLLLLAPPVSGEIPPILSRYTSQTAVYKTVNGETLDLILFLPKVKKYEKTPLMVYMHGGGWRKGTKFNLFNRNAMDLFLEQGIACASVKYRLVRPGISALYDCVVDCKDAVRFLVKHADEYGLDADRMGSWGSSAGGHLCLMTALAPDDLFPGALALKSAAPRFRCVVSYFPVTTFANPDILSRSTFFKNPKMMPLLFGGQQEVQAKMLSPVEYFSTDSPPVLLVHGDQDPLVHYVNSTYALDRAKKNGAEAQLLTVTNGMHSFRSYEGREIEPSIDEITRIVAAFIIEKMVGK